MAGACLRSDEVSGVVFCAMLLLFQPILLGFNEIKRSYGLYPEDSHLTECAVRRRIGVLLLIHQYVH
jgi:hypothetical protein